MAAYPTVQWSEFGSPNSAGCYCLPRLGGLVDVAECDVTDAGLAGGDPAVRLCNQPGSGDGIKRWTIVAVWSTAP